MNHLEEVDYLLYLSQSVMSEVEGGRLIIVEILVAFDE